MIPAIIVKDRLAEAAHGSVAVTLTVYSPNSSGVPVNILVEAVQVSHEGRPVTVHVRLSPLGSTNVSRSNYNENTLLRSIC